MRSGIELTIKIGEREVLTVTSDGDANFHVQGDRLRHGVNEYDTTDDHNVMGQVVLQLGVLLSGEVIEHALNERVAGRETP